MTNNNQTFSIAPLATETQKKTYKVFQLLCDNLKYCNLENKARQEDTKEALGILLNGLHQWDLSKAIPEIRALTRDTGFAETAWTVIEKATLEMAEIPPTRGYPVAPWDGIEGISNKAQNTNDKKLDNLATEAFIIALKKLPESQHTHIMENTKMLLERLPEESPHRTTVLKIVNKVINNEDRPLSNLIKDKGNNDIYPLNERIGGAINKKFNALSTGEKVQHLLRAASTPDNMKALTDSLGREQLITAFQEIPDDALLSLVFKNQSYRAMTENITPEAVKNLTDNMDWDNIVPL